MTTTPKDRLPTAIEAKWNAAGANPGTKIDLGDIVVCDSCMTDYRGKSASGGFIFESKAIGPCCEQAWRKRIDRNYEQDKIRESCPRDMTFQQFVLAYRAARGNNAITIRTGVAALSAVEQMVRQHEEQEKQDLSAAWWRKPMTREQQFALLDTTHTYGCSCDQCCTWWALMGPDGGEDGNYGPFTKEQVNARQREIEIEVTP